MFRLFDVILSILGLFLSFPLLLIIYVFGYFNGGSPLYYQERVGWKKGSFTLIKFRTMSTNTASLASHLVSSSAITKVGGFLRRTKLDELPQLWNVLKGEMSFVGPRPNLFNQYELIKERDALGVYNVSPGITGLAQINKIDMSDPKLLAKTDKKMIETLTLLTYFGYVLVTLTGKGSGDRVHF